jgi:hypothetical protein
MSDCSDISKSIAFSILKHNIARDKAMKGLSYRFFVCLKQNYEQWMD